MSLVALCSAKGSPGTTTVSLLLARELARRLGRTGGVCLLDADPDGGDVAVRLGLDPVPGAGTLALAGRHGIDDGLLLAHSQRTTTLPGVAVVAGISGRAQQATLDWLVRPLADAAVRSPLQLVVDLGRIAAGGPASVLLERAGEVLVVCRSDTASVVHTRSALIRLRAQGIAARAVVAARDDRVAEEVSMALGHPVAGVVPLGHGGPFDFAGPRLPVASLRAEDRALQRAIGGLAAFVLGQAPALVTPQVAITEHAPDAVRLVAGRLHRPEGEEP